MTLKKILFAFLGTLSLILGVIGIFVPGLPTTPFLLLTAGLYMKSSERLYKLLISNKYLGPYILD
ncbi:MAG: YbaN family protein, partial [Bacteroidales bacterium]|nr:YbaN family protein [Bacteroidales bacterium]